MNAVEIEEAVSALTEAPFDATEFPYAFLAAFGNKDTTLRKLRSAKASETSNRSDVGGVLQRNNIHLAVAAEGDVSGTLAALRTSPATTKHKARFILATDGLSVEAEELESGEPLACAWADLANHFGFFLPLAGITTVRQIRENAFDIRATSKLNKLYVELLKTNPEWGSDERRPDMNHFMARLIFSFFAEDTGIMAGRGMFTDTVSKMSAPDASNTHEVIAALFEAMNTPHGTRSASGLRSWAISFPYVNGGLFAGTDEVPRFSRTARAFLLQVGSLDWKQINPDIFGSMIQAVADDEERGALGMHYTSVPNILKVLNPLFLDDLRKIEHEINRRRGELERRSDIPLTNFRGIELRDFAAEIARLALIIAEFQCDELYRGQQEAIRDFLPLSAENWITCGNALRLDWLSVCPPTGTSVKLLGDDLFSTPLDQSEIDFENAGGETYVCGNPPYLGFTWQSDAQKADLQAVAATRIPGWKSLDYVSAWFIKAADFGCHARCRTAFVATNSICQGEQVSLLWPLVFATGHEICFAHTSFRWANLAAEKAVVTVVIIGMERGTVGPRTLYTTDDRGVTHAAVVGGIGPYLAPGANVIVAPRPTAPSDRSRVVWGNKPTDGGHLFLTFDERRQLLSTNPEASRFVRRFLGAKEFIHGIERYCLWIGDDEATEACKTAFIAERLEKVALFRSQSKAAETRPSSAYPHRFRQVQGVGINRVFVIATHSSESRAYLPVGVESNRSIVGNHNFAMYDAPLWNMALIASRLHLVWVGAVCGKIKTDYRYSNVLGWNTFPIPTLTEQNTADLTRCAEDILLAREAHYPSSIADLYAAGAMPTHLRDAHERNDEVLERIYIGRRFRNDTERLEKLFAMYTQLTAAEKKSGTTRRSRA
jgi:hypothetical protein